MKKNELLDNIQKKQSCLCIGLDVDIQRVPVIFRKNPTAMLEFLKIIIDATSDLAIAYKLNTAFYEQYGLAGWELLEKTLAYIPNSILTIADAKRGDIGNSSMAYARTFFETLPFDGITVNPYMGKDSIAPFLSYPDKWVWMLGLTSNTGAQDFQMLKFGDTFLFEKVIQESQTWESKAEIGYVVGATQDITFDLVRKIVPDSFLLVPGIGVQGGNLQSVLRMGPQLLINASRSVIYASAEADFAQAARGEAVKLVEEIKKYAMPINNEIK